jgi:hypothetical protein
MFAKQSLKNRFKALETKLTDQNAELKQETIATAKSEYPELHARLKADSAQEEELSFYLRSIKNSFNRIAIKEASGNHLAFENELARLINGFTKAPCLIQVIHPQDQKGLENFKLLILALNETQGQWRLLFKDLKWVGVNFATSALVLTFDQNQMEFTKVEGLLKTVSTRSNHLLSFNIQKKDGQFVVGLRLEANITKKISTERDTAL